MESVFKNLGKLIVCGGGGGGGGGAQVEIWVLIFIITFWVSVFLSRPPCWPSGKASASRAEDPGFESRLRRDFFEVESYQ